MARGASAVLRGGGRKRTSGRRRSHAVQGHGHGHLRPRIGHGDSAPGRSAAPWPRNSASATCQAFRLREHPMTDIRRVSSIRPAPSPPKSISGPRRHHKGRDRRRDRAAGRACRGRPTAAAARSSCIRAPAGAGGMAPGIQVTLDVLQPGERTVPYRQNSTQVNFVIHGEGIRSSAASASGRASTTSATRPRCSPTGIRTTGNGLFGAARPIRTPRCSR